MKNVLLTLVFSIVSLISYNQNSFEAYQLLRKQIDTIKIDSFSFGELYGVQLDEIFMDSKQLQEALKFQNDSLTNQIKVNELLIQSITKKKTTFFYIALATSVLLLVFIIIAIILIVYQGKMKKKQQKFSIEVGKLNGEIENLKTLLATEKEKYEQIIQQAENEKQRAASIIQRLTDEKANLKNDFENFAAEKNRLNETISSVQSDLTQVQLKCEELTSQNNELLEAIKEKDLLVENLKLQIEQHKLTEQSLKEKIVGFEEQLGSYAHEQLDELSKKINSLNEILTTKETELSSLKGEMNLLKQTNEINRQHITELENIIVTLTNENNQLKENLQKATETEVKVNNELKKFIAELQAILPLPKNR